MVQLRDGSIVHIHCLPLQGPSSSPGWGSGSDSSALEPVAAAAELLGPGVSPIVRRRPPRAPLFRVLRCSTSACSQAQTLSSVTRKLSSNYRAREKCLRSRTGLALFLQHEEPTCNEVCLGLFVGPGRVRRLALQAGADSAVPVPDEVGIIGPALGGCRCHCCVGIER